MAETIVDVHTLSSPTGYYFGPGKFNPVPFFALVSIVDSEYASLGITKSILAIPIHLLGGALVGEEVTEEMKSVSNESEM